MTTGRIIRLAEPHYSRTLAYHNFGHAVNIKPCADVLLDRCSQYNIPVNEEAVEWAVFYHDAEFGQDFKSGGFTTPEDLSAKVAETDMQQEGVPASTIALTVAAIRATNWALEPQSVESKILRAADIASLAAPYDSYAETQERLLIEMKATSKLELFTRSSRLLAKYLQWRVELTPEYFDPAGRSSWHMQAMSNMLIYYFQGCGEAGIDAKVIFDLDPSVMPAFKLLSPSTDLIIGIEPDDIIRQKLVLPTPLDGSVATELILPGESHLVPLPAETVDSLSMTEPTMIRLDAETKAEIYRLARNKQTPLWLKC